MRYQTKVENLRPPFNVHALPVEAVKAVGGESVRGFVAEKGDWIVTSPHEAGVPRIYSPDAFANLFEEAPEPETPPHETSLKKRRG